MATLIKPKDYDEFFLWDEATGFVIPSPIRPKHLAEIVSAAETIGHKNAKVIFQELWDANLAHYTKFLAERNLRIEYDKRSNEISLIKIAP